MSSNQAALLIERVQSLLAEALQLPPEQVHPELAFGDLPQWDSMGHMEVMMALELEFGVEINAETIAALTSIPAICSHIQENGHA
jgi:acyl carrier protein